MMLTSRLALGILCEVGSKDLAMAAPAFTDRDVEKAVSGATKGGFAIGRIDIDRRTGRISLFPAGEVPLQAEEPEDEISAWMEDDRRRAEGRS